MSRASTYTKLPLANWAKYMGMHPLHFEQVRLDTNPHCDQIMFQYAWQTADHVSREEIADAIQEAENRIERYLGYRLAPSWEVDEWHNTTRPYRQEFVNYNNHDIRGFNQAAAAEWGYFISGGVRGSTLIAAAAPVVYTDVDKDLYFETATVTVPTSVTNVNEIHVYYPDKAGADIWEIRPTQVSIASGIATITFRRELAVNPDLLERLDIEGAEAIGTVDADFLDTVDVYRVFNDPSIQADLLWEPQQGMCGLCNGVGCANCSYGEQTGCLLLRGDPRNSQLVYHPSVWNPDTQAFDEASLVNHRQPDIVRLSYYAGWRDKSLPYTNRMDPEWERAVTYLAAANLSRPPCDCILGNWQTWSEDTQVEAGGALNSGKSLYRQPDPYMENPFGFKRGEIYAWRKVKSIMRGRGVLL